MSSLAFTRSLHVATTLFTFIWATLFIGCQAREEPKHDIDLSSALILWNSVGNRPLPLGVISEIRIYRTTKANFLTSSEIGKLTPLAVVNSPSGIEHYFTTTAGGRVLNSNSVSAPNKYISGYYHIIGFNRTKTIYGNLKVQISSSSNGHQIARVQPLGESNSYVYNTALAEYLAGITGRPQSGPGS